MREAFTGVADDWLVFFRHLRLYRVSDTDREYRIALLRRLVARKRLKYERDGERLLKNKYVVKIEAKESTDDTPN